MPASWCTSAWAHMCTPPLLLCPTIPASVLQADPPLHAGHPGVRRPGPVLRMGAAVDGQAERPRQLQDCLVDQPALHQQHCGRRQNGELCMVHNNNNNNE